MVSPSHPDTEPPGCAYDGKTFHVAKPVTLVTSVPFDVLCALSNLVSQRITLCLCVGPFPVTISVPGCQVVDEAAQVCPQEETSHGPARLHLTSTPHSRLDVFLAPESWLGRTTHLDVPEVSQSLHALFCRSKVHQAARQRISESALVQLDGVEMLRLIRPLHAVSDVSVPAAARVTWNSQGECHQRPN